MKKTIVIFTALILIFISSCDPNSQDKLMKIGNCWITTEQFDDFTPRYTYKFLSPSEKDKKINDFIDRQLIIHDAIKNRYLKNSEILTELKNARTRSLIGYYFDKHITDSLITKDMLLTTYESLDLTKRELFTFDEYKPLIKEQLVNQHNQEMEAAYYKIVDRLKSDNNIYAISSNIDSLSRKYTEIFRDLYSKTKETPTPRVVLKTINYGKHVYSMNNEQYSFSDFLKALEDYPYSIPNRLSDPVFFGNIIENIILNDYIRKTALKNKYYNEPDFKLRMLLKRNTILHKYYMEKEIKSKIINDRDSLHTYYQLNKDSLYTTERLYEVHEIFIENKALAEQVLNLAIYSENYKKLSDKFTERYKSRPKKGYLGFITEDKYSSIGKTAAITKVGQVYPELLKSGDGYSIVKVLSVKEPEVLPFDKISDRVWSDYYRYKFSVLRKELLSKLKDKYTYNIDVSKLN